MEQPSVSVSPAKGTSSVQSRIDAAKSKLSDMKKQLKALKTAKCNGNMEQATSKARLTPMSSIRISLRKTLVGHFGKVMSVDSYQGISRCVSLYPFFMYNVM